MGTPVDLQHLRAFEAIAREGNLTRAAESLHLTQPAVSMQIKSLQELLQVTLFVRTGRGLMLSAHGRALVPAARKILEAVEEFGRAAEAMRSAAYGTLGLGTILNPEAIRLGACLQYLVEHHPNVQPRLRHGMSGWVLSQIRGGALDAAFYLGPPGEVGSGDDICALKLRAIHYYVIAPRGWDARVAGKSWAEVALLPWVWTHEHSTHHRMLSRKFDELGVRPLVAAEVDLEASMVDLVVSGVGLSLARDSVALRVAQSHGLVVAQTLTLTADLSFIALARRMEDPVVSAAFAAVRATYG